MDDQADSFEFAIDLGQQSIGVAGAEVSVGHQQHVRCGTSRGASPPSRSVGRLAAWHSTSLATARQIHTEVARREASLRRRRECAYGAGVTATTPDSAEPPQVFIVLDALDVEVVAAFWVEALRYRRVDQIEQYVVLVPREGNSGSVFLVQGVAEAKRAKNRMHLDLHVADPEAEAERLVGLGAVRTGSGTLGEITWITMTDPEGNEFDIGRR